MLTLMQMAVAVACLGLASSAVLLAIAGLVAALAHLRVAQALSTTPTPRQAPRVGRS